MDIYKCSGNFSLSNPRRYGCLFFTIDAPSGSHPATVEGDKLSRELKKNVADRFSIGPVVDTAFWSKTRGNMEINRGPCTYQPLTFHMPS